MLGEALARQLRSASSAPDSAPTTHLGGVAVLGCVVVGPLIQFVAHPPLGAPDAVLFVVYVAFIAATGVWGARHPVHWVFAWLGVLLWQNAMLGLSSRLSDQSPPVWATEAKTTMVYAMAAMLFVQRRTSRPPLLWSHRTLGVIGAGIFVGALASPTVSALPYVRNFTVYLCIVFVGSVISETVGWVTMRSVLTLGSITVLVVITAGAFVEWAVSTDTWRHFLGLDRLTHLRGVSTWTTVVGVSFRRIGSWNLEPVSTAFMAASAGAVLAMLGWRRHLPFIVLSVVIVFATAGKGALLLLGVVFVVRYLRLSRFFVKRPVACVVGLWAGTAALGLAYLTLSRGTGFALGILQSSEPPAARGESAAFHIAGFVQAAAGMVTHPVGRGLGSGGNLANAFGARFDSGAGNDTALGALFVQLGLVGAYGFVLACRDVGRRARSSVVAKRVAIPLFAAWICGWVYQEEVAGPLSSGLLLLAVGACLAGSPGSGAGGWGRAKARPTPIPLRRRAHSQA